MPKHNSIKFMWIWEKESVFVVELLIYLNSVFCPSDQNYPLLEKKFKSIFNFCCWFEENYKYENLGNLYKNLVPRHCISLPPTLVQSLFVWIKRIKIERWRQKAKCYRSTKMWTKPLHSFIYYNMDREKEKIINHIVRIRKSVE